MDADADADGCGPGAGSSRPVGAPSATKPSREAIEINKAMVQARNAGQVDTLLDLVVAKEAQLSYVNVSTALNGCALALTLAPRMPWAGRLSAGGGIRRGHYRSRSVGSTAGR
jgi:hypothetical protein